MLRDNFNRVINYLRVSVTDRCNLRCRYCIDKDLPFTPHDEILHYEEILRFVRIAATLGVQKVRLTGGEPLSRRDITFLIAEINSIEGITDISLTTNGVYLGEKVTELKDAGLRRVNISLDTLKRDRFSYITGVDVFDRVIASIEKAKELGLEPIKINTVIIKGFNDDEILDFALFAREMALQVRFIEFMPFGNDGLWDASKVVNSSAIEELLRAHHDLVPLANTDRGPATMFKINGSAGKIGFISPMSTHICAECNRIRLTPDGKLKPCLFSDTEYDLKALLRGGAGDDEIRRFVTDIVRAKPERKFGGGQVRKCQRSMRNTGG